jgi:hypothetical protein
MKLEPIQFHETMQSFTVTPMILVHRAIIMPPLNACLPMNDAPLNFGLSAL